MLRLSDDEAGCGEPRSSTASSWKATSRSSTAALRAAGSRARGGDYIAVPGFVDLQVNGFGGVDFLDADSAGYRRAGEALLETGVTAYQPTLITSPEETLLAALAEVPSEPEYPRILGAHLESWAVPLAAATRNARRQLAPRSRPGPARAAARRRDGAHDDARAVHPGASAVIARLLERCGVTVSLGHSDATAEQAIRAFDLGIATVTHLFNAMRPFLHRDPGIVGAALARDDVIVQLIHDGVHLAPETVQVTWRAAAGRVALVTDSITGAGVIPRPAQGHPPVGPAEARGAREHPPAGARHER